MAQAAGEPGEPPSGGSREWRVSEEFRHRLGCGLLAAIGLPAWFGIMALALGREASGLAVVVALVLFAVSAVIGVSAYRRLRLLPTSVGLDRDGWLRIEGRRLSLALPADALTEVEIGAAVGLESVRLHTRQGRTIRLPGDLDDLDGFLLALHAANPALLVTDHRPDAFGPEGRLDPPAPPEGPPERPPGRGPDRNGGPAGGQGEQPGGPPGGGDTARDEDERNGP